MDNMRKIAIMGKVFSDAKDVYVDIKIHDFEFNTLKIIHLPYAYKNENTEITPYPVVEFFIPSDIFGDDIPLEITLDTQLLKNEKVDFYFKKIKGTRMLRYGVMGETLEDLFTNTAYSDGKNNVIIDGESVKISDEEWTPYIHKTHIQNDDCLQCIKVNRGDWVYKFNKKITCNISIGGEYGISPVNPTPTKQGITANGETVELFNDKI